MVLNDIELIKYLEPLQLLQNEAFCINCMYLTGNYLSAVEKIKLRELEKLKKIKLFETDLNFYKLKTDSISLPETSSIYYSKMNNIPIVTTNKIISNICKQNQIKVYTISEALKFLNIAEAKVDFINRLINREKQVL